MTGKGKPCARHSARFRLGFAARGASGAGMDALLTSTALVALAEMGDKTQLLAIVLAARFQRPWPVIAGILVATLANHALAALAGRLLAAMVAADWFAYAVAASFVAMALWMLVPDTADDDAAKSDGRGAFLATAIAFFLVEIGDKTQVATIALGAQFTNVALVTLGTTAGMMIANVPAVLIGDRLAERLPLLLLQRLGALAFLALGLWLAVTTWLR